MPEATKLMYLNKNVNEDYILPKENQQIVKMLRCRGNNLYEVREPSGETYLVSIAANFKRTAWIRRGAFVIVERNKEGSPVKAEIHRFLFPYEITYIQDHGMWPRDFVMEDDPCNGSSDTDDEDLFINGIRPTLDGIDERTTESYSSSSESEDVNTL
ncbi:hypothetical protein HPB50_012444 [Hyalomma asiaticum]|uniref:Uncharacterized protein n=1 Tax=Hyalomma asiaticum TaxID=266040 RepID=A0ACB7RTC7_HYAAI|nr:hypothetical protein HPB50_012444 [Hyalomma asiaticum]